MQTHPSPPDGARARPHRRAPLLGVDGHGASSASETNAGGHLSGISIRTATPNGTPVLVVGGELDAANADRFAEAIDEARQLADRVTVDMRGVAFMDSSGVNVLVR